MPTYTSGGGAFPDVFPDGIYWFAVEDASEKESRRGNPMIELRHRIYGDGNSIGAYDYLVFDPKCFWKIDQFRVATGEQLIKDQRVTLEAEDCVGRKGRCHLIVETYEGKTRNKIEEYLPPEIPSTLTNPEKPDVNLNELGEPDDLPF
jgi:hypothetical protein